MLQPTRPALLLLLVTLGIAWPAHADPQDKLREVETEMDQQKQQASDLDRKARDTNENIKDLRARLIAATSNLQGKAVEEDHLKEKLEQLALDIAGKNKAFVGERKKLDQLMEAFIELSRQPPGTLVLHTQMTDDHIHRAELLREIVPRLREQADLIANELADLDRERTQMTTQKHLVAQAHTNMDAQRRNLDQLIAVRQGLLDRTESQKEALNHRMETLTSQARDLKQLLEKVTPKTNVALGSVPKALRGSLKWPVAGKVMRGFGAKDQDGVKSEGLTFATPPGSPVVAPASGRVVFAGPFKGYGKIVILQHEGGYHSFLAGFGRIDAEMGQEIEAGEPLGTMPTKDDSKPELYFEWRHNTEPVDPGVGSRRG